jgi:uncharacterized protein YdeI (YjbR/CyaY-like superfamily)
VEIGTPRFFASPSDFQKWFEKHHLTAQELWVGFHKKGTGKASITWPESVDEALCCGWIDGVRKRIDDETYTIRFSPRKPRSIWSAINIQRVQELTDQGRMQAAGLKAFQAREAGRVRIYSYEQERPPGLDEAYEKKLRGNKAAWKFFQAQAASYRKRASWWVMSAKQEDTRRKRLGKLIEESAQGRTL